VFGGRGIGFLSIHGDVTGGSGPQSGRINSAEKIGVIKITGSLTGNTGDDSGEISSGVARIIARAGAALDDGILRPGGLLSLEIGVDVTGNFGSNSGRINILGPIGRIEIGGSLAAGFGTDSGNVSSKGRLGSIEIGEDLAGGGIFADSIGSVLVKRSVTNGSFKVPGLVIAPTGERGAVIAAGSGIGSIDVLDSISGGSSQRILIIASGDAPGNVAIGSIQVGKNVSYADILGGYTLGLEGPEPVNGAARIGPVEVDGTWTFATLLAGVAPGEDGEFGTSDDEGIGGIELSSIARIVITGGVPLTESSDRSIFGARHIGSAQIPQITSPLISGPGNDFVVIGGGTGVLYEIGAVPGEGI
jgi:hypothetical protein